MKKFTITSCKAGCPPLFKTQCSYNKWTCTAVHINFSGVKSKMQMETVILNHPQLDMILMINMEVVGVVCGEAGPFRPTLLWRHTAFPIGSSR